MWRWDRHTTDLSTLCADSEVPDAVTMVRVTLRVDDLGASGRLSSIERPRATHASRGRLQYAPVIWPAGGRGTPSYGRGSRIGRTCVQVGIHHHARAVFLSRGRSGEQPVTAFPITEALIRQRSTTDSFARGQRYDHGGAAGMLVCRGMEGKGQGQSARPLRCERGRRRGRRPTTCTCPCN